MCVVFCLVKRLTKINNMLLRDRDSNACDLFLSAGIDDKHLCDKLEFVRFFSALLSESSLHQLGTFFSRII